MAWHYIGKAKSRTLLDFLRFIDLPAPGFISDPLIIREKKLLDSIQIRDKQARATQDSNQATILSQEITGLHADLNQLYDQMANIAPDYVELRKGQPLSFDGITDLLKNQKRRTAFVEYYLTDENVFIIVITTDVNVPELKIKALSYQDIFNYVSRYSREIENFPRIALEETWHEIADYLITPIWDLIKNCELLYFVPHGLLHYLPLHALNTHGKRLIEHVPAVYLSSLTQLKYAQAKKDETIGTCLVVGYTPNDDEKELFEGEARKAGKLFNIDAILEKEATKQLFAERASSGKDVIHLSCHGYFNYDEPLKSGILLYDGVLTAKEIFNMQVKANLLVLSACQTGLNEQKPGDELIGLTRAFLYAGVKSIMVSLWSVNAVATIQFMESFYTKIKAQISKAEALQQTQIEMIKDKQFSHPYYWAPFILIGDWN